MNKIIALILSLILLLSICIVPLNATEDTSNQTVTTNEESDEESNFTGEYKEYVSKNGMVTKVYDNGSVETIYKDGTREGIDFEGTRYTEDKDGVIKAYYTDGIIGTKYTDGTIIEENGDGEKIIYKTDGTYTTVDQLGLCSDYDENDTKTAMYFEGCDDKVTLVNGDFTEKSGSIKGKRGQKLTWDTKENEDGTTYIEKATGNGLKTESSMTFNEDGSDHIVIKRYDGLEIEANTDSDGNTKGFVKKGRDRTDLTINSDGSTIMTNTDGDRSTIDAKGNVHYINSNGLDVEYSLTNKKMSFKDKESGDEMITDEEGNMLSCHLTSSDGSIMTYKNGEMNIVDKDGKSIVKSTKNSDGSTTVLTETGDIYSISSDGKILKNGEPIEHTDEGKNNVKLTADDIIGTYDVVAVYSDIESPIVGMLQNFFDSIFGEGTGSDIVTPAWEDDEDEVTVNQIITIQKGAGDKLNVTLQSDDEIYLYSGTFRNNKLSVKYVSTLSDEGDSVDLEIEKLEYTFKKNGNEIVIDGSYRINMTLFKATYTTKGKKR